MELGPVNFGPRVAGRVNPESKTEQIGGYGAGKRGSRHWWDRLHRLCVTLIVKSSCGKAGPAGSQGKKKKVRWSQKKKATKPNGKAVMADALSKLDEEDESSSFERMSAFDRLGDPKSKKPRTSAFERLQDTRSARKGDLRDTLKEKRGESTATSKIGSEERRATVGDKGAAELWRMYERLEKRLDAQNPYRQAVFSEVTPFSRRIMSCPLPDNFKTPQIKAYNGTTDPQDHLARFRANVVMVNPSLTISNFLCLYFAGDRRPTLPNIHGIAVIIRRRLPPW
ncbi:unnamed protein product [Cuscuta campestris]|uniref:Retrotransposon gag domain-containing protein n=1 Tax=Cuscuta campestris TaxID=132261 RepID=A0A484M448_9ASTE|nr:unnamed protein product [Cuscuta campestris]